MSFSGIEKLQPKPKPIIKPKKVSRKPVNYKPEYFPDIALLGSRIETPYYVCEDCLTLNDDDHSSSCKYYILPLPAILPNSPNGTIYINPS